MSSSSSRTVMNTGEREGNFKANRKVPGVVQPIGKFSHEEKKHGEPLEKKTLAQLREDLEREQKILDNKKLMSKLPDKGKKVLKRKEAIERVIEAKVKEVNATADLLAHLKIDTDEMEWKYGTGGVTKLVNDGINGDEEVEKELKVLVQRELPPKQSKKNPLKDIPEEIESEVEFDKHVKELSKKVDTLKTPNVKFVLFNSAKQNTEEANIPLTRRIRVSPKMKPEELMPIPPEPRNKELKLVTLTESLAIQIRQAEKLKEMQVMQAVLRLTAAKSKVRFDVPVEIEDKMAYRDNPVNGNDYNEDYDDDPDDNEKVVNIIATAQEEDY